MEHTPTPWHFDHYRAEIRSEPEFGTSVATMTEWGIASDRNDEREANAAFIVRACNAHDELVAALKRIAEAQANMPPVAFEAFARKLAADTLARAALAKVQADKVAA